MSLNNRGNISKFETISGKPKLVFLCKVCNFTGKTSGFPKSCPKCHFDPITELEKQRVDDPILAETFEEVKA